MKKPIIAVDIDDQPKHCEAAYKLGIKTIIFGNYVWNTAQSSKSWEWFVAHHGVTLKSILKQRESCNSRVN